MKFKEKRLSIKSLKQGLVYVLKDGRLLLYCGKANTEEHLFYLVGSVNLMNNKENWRLLEIYNYEFMHQYVVDSVKRLMLCSINPMGYYYTEQLLFVLVCIQT